MKAAYAKLTVDKAQEAIHQIILDVYKNTTEPSRDIVDDILMGRFGIVLSNFFVSMEKCASGTIEVRCLFKAPAPDGKGFLGIWV